jgi:hypothetical protein
MILGEKTQKDRILVWFSCGAASAVAAKYTVEKYKNTNNVVEVIYCDTLKYEHPDNMRFYKDVEKWIGQEIKLLKSDEFEDIYDVFYKVKYIAGIAGAACTTRLKRDVRKAYEREGDTHVFGFTVDEQKRIERFIQGNAGLFCDWILADNNITKNNCYSILRAANIESPAMYKLGYKNNNCFAGHEKFITQNGSKSFYDTIDTTQTVLTSNGWEDGVVSNFGEQEIWELVVERNKSRFLIETTKDHEWIVPKYLNQSQGTVICTTEKLPIGKNVLPNFIKYSSVIPDSEAIKHGFVFGDGTIYTGKTQKHTYSKIQFCGEKKELSRIIFNKEDPRTIHGLDKNWKTLPLITASQEYKLGFLIGLLASDGQVVKGGVSISNASLQNANNIAEIAKSLGIFVNSIRSIIRDTNYKKDAKLSTVTFPSCCINPNWLLRTAHKGKFTKKCTRPKGFKIISVTATGKTQDVFCLTVPNINNFTLSNGMLTRNCIGCVKGGAGYWNKIREDFPEYFDKMAKCSRDLNVKLIKNKGVRIFLDELPKGVGRYEKEKDIECGVQCTLPKHLQEITVDTE